MESRAAINVVAACKHAAFSEVEMYDQWFTSQQGFSVGSTKARENHPLWQIDPVSQTPARRAQPTLVFRQIVPPVQLGHALGAALVEGRGECLFAGLVTTARSCPFHDFVTPWHNVRMPDLGRLPPASRRGDGRSLKRSVGC